MIAKPQIAIWLYLDHGGDGLTLLARVWLYTRSIGMRPCMCTIMLKFHSTYSIATPRFYRAAVGEKSAPIYLEWLGNETRKFGMRF